MNHSRTPSIDIEKCIKNSGTNKFEMILLAAARAKEIRKKNLGSMEHEHTHAAVTALLEIQDNKLDK